MAFTEDLTSFFETDDHAVSASYIRGIYPSTATARATTVAGIFENEYVETQFIQGDRPTFTCAASDVENIAQGDWLIISGGTYKVAEYRPDGTGVIMLILEAQD